MKLSTRVRYGLRAAVVLAENYGNGPMSVGSVAESQEISKKYLHAILAVLKAAGIVRSVRGTAGGYELAREPSGISVREVLETLEGSQALVDCVDDSHLCGRAHQCVTRELWRELTRAIEAVLSEISLEDLAERNRRADPPSDQRPDAPAERNRRADPPPDRT